MTRPLARRPSALLTVLGSATLVTAILVGSAIWPDASASAATAVAMVTHPGDDWAGSQIAKYEGDGSDPPLGPADASNGGLPGLDVSRYQSNVNWPAVGRAGAAFVYVKATESTNYTSPSFGQQYAGAAAAGLIHGAYHFAIPNASNGIVQADYFLAHGGRPSGMTLPPAVDLEYNPYGDVCYSMPPAALVAWVHDFSNEIRRRIGTFPTIYTSTSWWNRCTANNGGFGATNPLWVPRYGKSIGALPAGWGYQTFWQFADTGVFPGDQDYFNGTLAQLRAISGR
jgi:GH25 family lysozyme M1 (1,4-beta-N-acetylmuramidase)